LAQRGLFLPITPEAEKLEITLARIHGVVGERRSGIARLLDTHRRNGFRMERFVAAEEARQAEGPTMSEVMERPQLALRIFRPASRLQVRVSEGRPVTVAAIMPAKDCRELYGKVLWSAGPWRSSGDWWSENAKQESSEKEQSEAWDREEWDVALFNENGVALYRVYRDLASGQWFADASYD
jgi:protein ImuB